MGDWGLTPGLEDPMVKEIATHSSILTWRIPRTVSSWGPKESDTTERLSLSVSLDFCKLLCRMLFLLSRYFGLFGLMVRSREDMLLLGWEEGHSNGELIQH